MRGCNRNFAFYYLVQQLKYIVLLNNHSRSRNFNSVWFNMSCEQCGYFHFLSRCIVMCARGKFIRLFLHSSFTCVIREMDSSGRTMQVDFLLSLRLMKSNWDCMTWGGVGLKDNWVNSWLVTNVIVLYIVCHTTEGWTSKVLLLLYATVKVRLVQLM